jgi:hypothetical protein
VLEQRLDQAGAPMNLDLGPLLALQCLDVLWGRRPE